MGKFRQREHTQARINDIPVASLGTCTVYEGWCKSGAVTVEFTVSVAGAQLDSAEGTDLATCAANNSELMLQSERGDHVVDSLNNRLVIFNIEEVTINEKY